MGFVPQGALDMRRGQVAGRGSSLYASLRATNTNSDITIRGIGILSDVGGRAYRLRDGPARGSVGARGPLRPDGCRPNPAPNLDPLVDDGAWLKGGERVGCRVRGR